MATAGGVLTRLKQPEYTGKNRCMPCTIVNTVIAAVGSAVLFVALWQTTTLALAGGVSLGAFGLSLGIIYFRGYLVPGTPELTKQYFPVWLLSLFGKGPAAATAPGTRSEPDLQGEIDPEQHLMRVGALEECDRNDDLCLTEDFRTDWYDEINRVEAEDAGRDRLLELLDIESANVRIEEFEGAFRAFVDEEVVGTWQSRAAYLADLGAANVLAERHERWHDLPVEARGQLLNGLRLFIDTCPVCGGVPEFETETVESCCSTHQVAAVSCDDCGARLFETHA